MRPSKPGWRTHEQTLVARKLRREVSKTEKRLWPHLRDGQLGASFRRQHVIADHYVDYCCVALKLVVEVDGPMHDPVRDTARDAQLAKLGYDVLRFGVQEIDTNLQGVVSTIYAAVQMRLMTR